MEAIVLLLVWAATGLCTNLIILQEEYPKKLPKLEIIIILAMGTFGFSMLLISIYNEWSNRNN